jgi:hypothetical protein
MFFDHFESGMLALTLNSYFEDSKAFHPNTHLTVDAFTKVWLNIVALRYGWERKGRVQVLTIALFGSGTPTFRDQLIADKLSSRD